MKLQIGPCLFVNLSKISQRFVYAKYDVCECECDLGFSFVSNSALASNQKRRYKSIDAERIMCDDLNVI